MSKLCVTRQKARNLLYEYNVRKYSSSNNQQSLLVNELIDMLFNPIVSEDKNSKIIKLQVENPYMIDYIKNIFARERILVDGSFSPDIITINKNEFIICTESGIDYRLNAENPEKQFYYTKPTPCCRDMKLNTLEAILSVLKNENNEIFVDEEIRQKALKPLERMLSLAK